MDLLTGALPGSPRWLPRLLAWMIGSALFSSSPILALTATFHSATEVPITAEGYDPAGDSINFQLDFHPPTGTTLTVVRNTGLPFIDGTFTNLAQGEIVELPFDDRTYRFIADYFGGTGNDLVLQWADTRLLAWGENFAGGIGTGDLQRAYSPAPVRLTGELARRTVHRMTTGFGFSLALCTDGSLVSWGRNEEGQLGDGTTINRLEPVAVDMSGALAGKRVISIGAGYDHCLVLCSDGTAAAWGSNVTSPMPVVAPLDHSSLVDISAGSGHNLALCADGTVLSWDSNLEVSSNVPAPVDPNGIFADQGAVEVHAGQFNSYAILADGNLVSWGSGAWGMLGTGSYDYSKLPQVVDTTDALAGKRVTSIATGTRHVLALCSDGTLAGWGQNDRGQLGTEMPEYSNTPIQIPQTGALAEKALASIFAGIDFSLASCTDGTLAAWGDSHLGNGDYRESSTPVAVLDTALAAGESYSKVRTSTYSVHSLALAARPMSPRMVLTSEGVPISGKDTTLLLGSVGESQTLTRTISISNAGLAPLEVDEVFFEGPHAEGFVVSTQPESPIAPGGQTNVVIEFTAGEGFGRNAMLQIDNDDPDQENYKVGVTATVQRGLMLDPAANGPVIAPGFDLDGSSITLSSVLIPQTGVALRLLDNTGRLPISGAFTNLSHGQTISIGHDGKDYDYVANYFGGDGNDLLLQWKATRLVAWGANELGQLGNGTGSNSRVPVPVDAKGALVNKAVLTLFSRYDHNLAVCADGSLVGWGLSTSGQVGNGTYVTFDLPVPLGTGGVLAGKKIIATAVGQHHRLALCSDGTLAAWGRNSIGQLGDGTTETNHEPLAVDTAGVLADKRVIAIAAGIEHSLVLCSDGTIASWGGPNTWGILGNGTRIESSVPTRVITNGAMAGKTAVAIAAGDSHNMALCSDGTVFTWGTNFYGELGAGSPELFHQEPVAVDTSDVLADKFVTSISAGGSNCAALCSDGSLITWGSATYGSLGNDNSDDQFSPTLVDTSGALSGRTPLTLTSGGSHTIISCSDGTLAAWGRNNKGQIGDGSYNSQSIAVGVDNSSLHPGESFTTGVLSQGALHSTGIIALPHAPRLTVEGSDGTAISDGAELAFSGSETKMLTIRNDGIEGLEIGAIFIAGPHSSEFVLSNTPTGIIEPGAATTIEITFNTGSGFFRNARLQISSNDPTHPQFELTLSAKGSGTLDATFENADHIPMTTNGIDLAGSDLTLSLGFPPEPGTILTVVRNTGPDFIRGRFDNLDHGQQIVFEIGGRSYDFTANYYGDTGNDLILQWSGTRIIGWGNGSDGQLGDRGASSQEEPISIPSVGVLSGKVILSLAAGERHSLALCSDGTVAAWGSNSFGQLGDGSTDSSLVPVATDLTGELADKTVIAIAAGRFHSLALCSDGTVVAWGRDSFGQLGTDSSVNGLVPTIIDHTGVLSGKSVTGIAAGMDHNLALCSDGTIAAWGSHRYGQLGIGSPARQSSSIPVAVYSSKTLAGKQVVQVAAGGDHSLALCSDGSLVTWGSNRYGQLGLGESEPIWETSAPAPVDSSGILAGIDIASISAGGFHNLALATDGKVVAWGRNSNGQLGNGETNSVNSIPLFVSREGPLGESPPIAISTMKYGSIAVLADGTVATWGGNTDLGDTTHSATPERILRGDILTDERIMIASSGDFSQHALALAAFPRGPRLILEIEEPAGTMGDVESLSLGAVLPGETVSRTVVIRNPGDEAFNELTIHFDGPDAEAFSFTPPATLALAAGEALDLELDFTPSAARSYQAALELFSDPAVSTSPLVVNLAGIGLTQIEAWRLEYFGSIHDNGDGADFATPLGDGIPNLVKFALAMDPTKFGSITGDFNPDAGVFLFCFDRSTKALAEGISCHLEWSDDLTEGTWSQEGVVETITDHGSIQSVFATVPRSPNDRRFVRFRAIRP